VTSPDLSLLFEQIHAVLPQTQCTRCGFPDCAAYALAIASGQAAINQCPPGGAEGIRRLSIVTGLPVLSLNPLNGVEIPRAMAVIDEAWCIGCTLCLKACPVDAIVGSHKLMHTVMESACTGCGLCLPPCPVDCISLDPLTGSGTGWEAWSAPQAQQALDSYEFHSYRSRQDRRNAVKSLEISLEATAASVEPVAQQPQPSAGEAERKRAVIQAALERSRAQRAGGA
jgi:electron transport complex protein RnfB